MGVGQFSNTIKQIVRSEGVNRVNGLGRHISWQFRKMLGAFPVELRISNSRLFVEQPSGVAALVNCLGVYDYNNMNLIQMVLHQLGGTLFDVGANIGAYALVASEVSRARVVSFEPHPRAYNALVSNIKLNSRSNVEALNIAVSDHEGHVYLTDGAELSTNRVVEDQGENALRVQSKTLDTICRELELEPIIVKVDVEGHEKSLLRGFQGKAASTELLLVENGERLVQVIKAMGFAGPFFFHLRKGAFLPYPQRRPEDPIFIRHAFMGRLVELGLQVAGGR